MMDKNTLLQEISQAASSKVVSKREVVTAYEAGEGKHNVKLSTILSYLGGAIMLLGIVIYFAQQWSDITGPLRIFLSLIVGGMFYLAGVLLHQDSRTKIASYGIFIVAFLLIPFGFYVTFHVLGISPSVSLIYIILPPLLIFSLALGTAVMLKNNFFVLLSIIFATWLYYATIGWLLETLQISTSEINFGLIILQGLAYAVLGYYYSQIEDKKELTKFLYGFGSLITLGGAFGLMIDWDNVIGILLYPAAILGAILASVKLSSKSFLVFGTLSLIAYITYITSRYFADSIGWPIALIFIGIAIILISLGSLQFNKRFLSNKNNA